MKTIKTIALLSVSAFCLAGAYCFIVSADAAREARILERNARPIVIPDTRPAQFLDAKRADTTPRFDPNLPFEVTPAPPRVSRESRTTRIGRDPYLLELQRANDIAEADSRARLLDSVRMRPVQPQPLPPLQLPSRADYDALIEMRRANDTLERLERDIYYDGRLTR